MKTRKQARASNSAKRQRKNFFGDSWDESWVYSKTVIDVAKESVLILDKDSKVKEANESFYRTFQVNKKDTEGKSVYQLGDGQWDTIALHELIDKVHAKPDFFGGFEVTHTFPVIGRKVFLLHARQIHTRRKLVQKDTNPVTLIAFEDITEMMALADSFAEQMIK